MNLNSKTLKNFNSIYKQTHAKDMANIQTLIHTIACKSQSKIISMKRLGSVSPDQLSLEINQGSSSNIFSSIPRRHKKQKPVNRGTYERSRLCRVHQLDMKDPDIRKIPRAGVVFYSFIGDELHMCYGRDRKFVELTDFGGRRIEKINETPIRCAVREGNEESRCAFSEITVDQVQGFFCLYSSNMLIIFIPVASPNDMDIREITRQNFNDARFLTQKQKVDRRYNEISEIVWLNEADVSNLFSKRPTIQMFAKVRRFIYSCNQLSQNVNVMKNVLKSVITDVPQNYSIDDMQRFYVSQITRPTPQEILLDSYNYHTWEPPTREVFGDHNNVSPRYGQSCSASLYSISNSSGSTLLAEDISGTHRLIRAVNLAC